MKLYDIRVALRNLVQVNKELNKDKLENLLQAAGWNKEDIEDALHIWETTTDWSLSAIQKDTEIIKKEDLTPAPLEEHVPTTEMAEISIANKVENATPEERVTPTEIDEADTQTKPTTPYQDSLPTEKHESQTYSLKEERVDFSPKKEEEIIHEVPPSEFTYISKQTEHKDLPANLPLKPFESSYVTVPLKEYEKRFVSTSAEKENPEIKKEAKQEAKTPVLHIDHVDRIVEAPLEKQDTYMVVLATILFVFIMFILGYMHLIGRI
jgi:hypothetical protein